ncbi:hypothetical protein FQN52_002913 [Onygenales sp. PD_12]|nr:hypothetical protein FQN52_002913 [Onygenales sp. PD_12]
METGRLALRVKSTEAALAWSGVTDKFEDSFLCGGLIYPGHEGTSYINGAFIILMIILTFQADEKLPGAANNDILSEDYESMKMPDSNGSILV